MDPREKLAALKAEQAKRDEARAEAELARQIETLELVAKLEAELGPRGSKFEILETVDGPIGLRLGEAVLHQRFTESKVTPADVSDFVLPCVVHPERAKFLALVDAKPGVLSRCAHALLSLYAAKRTEEAGKL